MAGLNVIDLYPRGTFGEQLGGVLSGLGSDVAQRIDRRNKVKQLAPLFMQQGATQEEALALANADPRTQQQWLQDAQQRAQFEARGQEEAEAQRYLTQAEQGMVGVPALDSLGKQQQVAPQAIQPQEVFDILGRVQPGAQELAAEEPRITQDEVMQAPSSQRATPEGRLQSTIKNLEQQLADPKISPRVKASIRANLDKKQEQFTKASDRLFDKTETVRSKIVKDAREAEELIDVLERQKVLNERGDLTTPGTLKFFEEIGMDISGLKSDDTQEFIKNNGAWLKNLKSYFGGNVTTSEMNQLMKTIANEYQSPEGRRRVIESLLKGTRGSVIRLEAMDKIMDQNGGLPTITLDRDVEKVAAKDLKEIKKQYLTELKKKPLPAAESRASILAKGIAGKAAGPLATAGAGALLGSVVPGIGTAAGGLGGLLGGLGSQLFSRATGL
ncbi:MAG TPA: hypothetical protein VMV86_03530 [Methanosarcinales archaeon]|nr:hypothetical protein [Methanosarcinales archaeon]